MAMTRFIFYTVLLIVLFAWAIGSFYLKEAYYIHSLLVMAGLMLFFRYVYKQKPVTQHEM